MRNVGLTLAGCLLLTACANSQPVKKGVIPNYSSEFLLAVADQYEQMTFICPDPSLNSDAGYEDSETPLLTYQDDCHHQMGFYGNETRKVVSDWAVMIDE